MVLLYPVGEDQINACWRSVFNLAKTVRTTGVELQLMRVSSGATETTVPGVGVSIHTRWV